MSNFESLLRLATFCMAACAVGLFPRFASGQLGKTAGAPLVSAPSSRPAGDSAPSLVWPTQPVPIEPTAVPSPAIPAAHSLPQIAPLATAAAVPRESLHPVASVAIPLVQDAEAESEVDIFAPLDPARHDPTADILNDSYDRWSGTDANGDMEEDPDRILPTGRWMFGNKERLYRPIETPLADDKKKAWYEKYSIRGYAQFRYNRLGETNSRVRSGQGDRSIGDRQSFLLRRARLILSGDVSDRVYIYIQPDFASGALGPNPQHFLQIRDFYSDIFLDEEKEFRFRVGQSKVPFGFENLQSSQNRLPLDRNDALNSSVANERDLGIFFYWAPDEIRQRFRHLVQSGLKGSGDYGVIGLGVYNGQTANRPERNNNVHTVARFTYPWEFSNGQFFEAGVSGYTGVISIDRTMGIGPEDDFTDRRIAMHWVYYPQPLGFQGEFNWGIGPQLNEALTLVEERSLQGGMVQVYYREELDRCGVLIPFVRWQYYRGGRKQETNTPTQRVNETEIGVEWEPFPELEMTAMYVWTDRTTTEFPYPNEYGNLIRLQLQWNY